MTRRSARELAIVLFVSGLGAPAWAQGASEPDSRVPGFSEIPGDASYEPPPYVAMGSSLFGTEGVRATSITVRWVATFGDPAHFNVDRNRIVQRVSNPWRSFSPLSGDIVITCLNYTTDGALCAVVRERALQLVRWLCERYAIPRRGVVYVPRGPVIASWEAARARDAAFFQEQLLSPPHPPIASIRARLNSDGWQIDLDVGTMEVRPDHRSTDRTFRAREFDVVGWEVHFDPLSGGSTHAFTVELGTGPQPFRELHETQHIRALQQNLVPGLYTVHVRPRNSFGTYRRGDLRRSIVIEIDEAGTTRTQTQELPLLAHAYDTWLGITYQPVLVSDGALVGFEHGELPAILWKAHGDVQEYQREFGVRLANTSSAWVSFRRNPGLDFEGGFWKHATRLSVAYGDIRVVAVRAWRDGRPGDWIGFQYVRPSGDAPLALHQRVLVSSAASPPARWFDADPSNN